MPCIVSSCPTIKKTLRSLFNWLGWKCLAALAYDVTSLEPYLSCGQLDNKAQGFALGSLARLEQFVQSFTTQIKNSPIHS